MFRAAGSKKGESGGFGFQDAVRHDLDRFFCSTVFLHQIHSHDQQSTRLAPLRHKLPCSCRNCNDYPFCFYRICMHASMDRGLDFFRFSGSSRQPLPSLHILYFLAAYGSSWRLFPSPHICHFQAVSCISRQLNLSPHYFDFLATLGSSRQPLSSPYFCHFLAALGS